MDQPKWLPSDEEIMVATVACFRDEGVDPIRALIRTAVEKALAEEWKKNLDAKEELIRRFRELQAEQEARHRRELIEVKIAAYEYAAWNTREAPFTSTLQALAAELAAMEVKP